MVKLRTALVLLLCASVGVHAGVKQEDLVKMTPQGGLVNTWLYEKVVVEAGENRTVLCINTTEATDPCTDKIDMPDRYDGKDGKETDISFGFFPSDDVSIKDGGTSAMKVAVTPKANSSGIMASNSRAADLLNQDKEPMKTQICTEATEDRCGGKLDAVGYSVYATIRKEKDSKITFNLMSDDVFTTYEGRLSVAKISMCYGVLFNFNPPKSVIAVPQGSTCASKKVFKVTKCRPVPTLRDLGEKAGRRNKNRRSKNNSKKRTSKKNRRSEKKTKKPTKAPTNPNCEPHIMD